MLTLTSDLRYLAVSSDFRVNFSKQVYLCKYFRFAIMIFFFTSLHRNDYSKYWHQFWDFRYGNCFTFNGGMDDEYQKQTILETRRSGSSGGMHKRDK